MRKKKFDNHDKLLMLWCLAKRNDILDRYQEAVKHYCFTCENWDAVLALIVEAHHNGISDDELIEIDMDIYNSITEEDVKKIIGE